MEERAFPPMMRRRRTPLNNSGYEPRPWTNIRFAPVEEDQWLKIQAQKASLPDLYRWRHRLRVLEHVLMDAHPEREHIRRVLASEEAQAVSDAKAIMRTQEMTGVGTVADIQWPPRNCMMVAHGIPGRTIPGMEAITETDTEDERSPSPGPQPHCGRRRFRERRRSDRDDGGSGPTQNPPPGTGQQSIPPYIVDVRD